MTDTAATTATDSTASERTASDRTAPAPGRSIANDHPVLRRHWHPVARVDDVTVEPLRVVLCGESLVVVRLPEGVTVLPDRCPHRNAPLSAGRVVDGHLECPYHGWRFGTDGGCRFIPALGEGATVPPRAHLSAPAVRELYGMVLVCLEPGDDEVPLLSVPEWEAPGIVPVWLPVVQARGGGAQLLDNFLDFTHFPFIHAGTFGAGEDALVGDYEVEHDDHSLLVRYEHVVENSEDPLVATGEHPLLQPRCMEYTYTVPFAGRLRLDMPMTGVQNTILFWASPVDADHSRVFCALLRNDVAGPDDPAATAAAEYELRVLTEDVWMLEQLPTTSLPLELPAQAHTRADRITVEMRRLLAAMVGA